MGKTLSVLTFEDLRDLDEKNAIKKEDLKNVSAVFDENWEEEYFESGDELRDSSFGCLNAEYEYYYDPSFVWGLSRDIFVKIYTNFGIAGWGHMMFFSDKRDRAGRDGDDLTAKITNKVKKELEKMGIPKNKKLDEHELNLAAFRAGLQCTKARLISYFYSRAH